jgi:hypothetical protein
LEHTRRQYALGAGSKKPVHYNTAEEIRRFGEALRKIIDIEG